MDQESYHLELSDSGGITRLAGSGYEYTPWLGESLYEINGELAAVKSVSEKALSLAIESASATHKITAEEKIVFKPDITLKPEQKGKGKVETVGIVLSFPLEAEFHLPEYRTTGRLIDQDMPLGESYSGRAAYNFLLVQNDRCWLRFMIQEPNMGKLSYEITRHPRAFLLTVTWPLENGLELQFFSSLEAAQDSFRTHLRERYGVTPLAEREELPSWIRNVRMVFTIDMLRSNGEICHDYSDVKNLAIELSKIGCPKDTLFYLPGWNADYDAGYPTYRPHDDLGGEPGFREMMASLHEHGYRVIVHANPRGIDPSHPDFSRFSSLLQRREDGALDGWQIAPGKGPPSGALKFRTGKIAFPQPAGHGAFRFETVEVLDYCEATIRMGQICSGAEGVRVSIGRRSFIIPPGAMAKAKEYLFPYAFFLSPGRNRVEIQVLGQATDQWDEGWYRIEQCYRYPDPYGPWTYPIQHADTENPEWIEIFVHEIERAVKRYHLDAVHLDAATLNRPRDNHKLFNALRDRIPHVPIGGEWCSTLEDMGYWTFCQGAVKSLILRTENARRTRDCNSTPPLAGLNELYGWLDKTSPVCSFVTDYFSSYLHLCATDAFVPVGKVCNILPERKMPLDSAELWRSLRDARRFGTLPNLRVNYRRYGLDEETKKALIEIAAQKNEARPGQS